MQDSNKPTIGMLFPEKSRVLLSGGGKEFVERIGVEAVRQAVLNVMLGENIRDQTEPLTRQRVAEISGAIVALFARGQLRIENFTDQLSQMSLDQIETSKSTDKATVWLSQWLIGLTGKSNQNVLRRDKGKVQAYITHFEDAIEQATEKCQKDMGDIKMTLGFVEDHSGQRAELNWKDITRLTTAIGCQTLTIRGSEKSAYGKLFERLILGSFLTILGFQRVDPTKNQRNEKVFWLSDSSGNRESDATAIYKPGKVARFDIGFIGPGNSEISKDKLSRYAREMEAAGGKHSSATFIVVDRLPETNKTKQAARDFGAEIVQMSMQYWPRDLAQRLGERLGFTHELQQMPDREISGYMADKLQGIPIQDFLTGVAIEELETNSGLPSIDEELTALDNQE